MDLGGNGGFLGFRIPWESRKSHENPGNPGNPMEILGILGIPWESWEYYDNSKSIHETYIGCYIGINLCHTKQGILLFSWYFELNYIEKNVLICGKHLLDEF